MRYARRNIKDRALSHLRAAMAKRWTVEITACDYAIQALVAEGYTEEQARPAVKAVWAMDFSITDPN